MNPIFKKETKAGRSLYEKYGFAGMQEIHNLIDTCRFSEIDLPAVLMFLRDKGL